MFKIFHQIRKRKLMNSLFGDKTTGYSLIEHVFIKCLLISTRKFGAQSGKGREVGT